VTSLRTRVKHLEGGGTILGRVGKGYAGCGLRNQRSPTFYVVA